jgi:hypothetical protein
MSNQHMDNGETQKKDDDRDDEGLFDLCEDLSIHVALGGLYESRGCLL